MKLSIVSLTVVIAAAGCAPPRVASPGACDRGCLKGMLDLYFERLIQHDASKLPTSTSVKVTENGRPASFTEGLWKSATAITYRLDAVDPATNQVATEAVVKEGGQPAHLLVRLKLDADRKINEVETILCRKGQNDLFGPDRLTTIPALYAASVAESERNTREQMAAIADAYFTAIQTEGGADYKPAPLAADADRFENGIQTTNVPIFGMPAASAPEQLEKGFFKGLTLVHRRFPVIDEERGIALGIAVMQIKETAPQGLLLSEMFKISGGKIRQIQAVHVNHPNDGPTGWN